jgi:DcmR-like sensory protein
MEASDRSRQFAGGILGRQRHVCAFFNSAEEEHRVLGSFIKDGIDGGERAFHIVDPELHKEHLRWLAGAGINVDRAMGTGQLQVRPWQDAYLRGDRFDQDAMLAFIEEVLQAGPGGGYPLTRLVAQMEWALLEKPGVEDLLEYEIRLNRVLPKYDDAVICTYDLRRISAPVAIDIMRTHPAVIIGGLLHENPFFVPPEQFLLELRDRARVRKS